MRRTIMFALRSSAVDRGAFASRYGIDPLHRFGAELSPFLNRGLVSASDTLIEVTDRGAPFADSIALHLVSDRVREQIRLANSRITDLKRDPVDRYDFSPIERDPVAATVSPLPMPEVPKHLD